MPQIEVTFDIDADGILSVRARDKVTGQTQSITIQNASTLDRSEIDRLVDEAAKNAELDQERKKKIDLKNRSEIICYQAEKQINEPNNAFTETDKEEITTLVNEIKSIKDTDNSQQIEEKIKMLEEKLRSSVGSN